MTTARISFLLSSFSYQVKRLFTRVKEPVSACYPGIENSFYKSVDLSKTKSAISRSTVPVCATQDVFFKNSAFNRLLNFSGYLKVPTEFHSQGFHSSAALCVMGYKGYSELRQLYIMHNSKPKPVHKKKKILDGNPQMKGVVLKTLIKKPKKPNSANRKCVLVRLSNGKEAVAYVPGEGHNLQEHNIVLVRKGRVQDVPGLKLKVIRGKYDCAHVIKKKATA